MTDPRRIILTIAKPPPGLGFRRRKDGIYYRITKTLFHARIIAIRLQTHNVEGLIRHYKPTLYRKRLTKRPKLDDSAGASR